MASATRLDVSKHLPAAYESTGPPHITSCGADTLILILRRLLANKLALAIKLVHVEALAQLFSTLRFFRSGSTKNSEPRDL